VKKEEEWQNNSNVLRKKYLSKPKEHDLCSHRKYSFCFYGCDWRY